jgi:hypothetical protein
VIAHRGDLVLALLDLGLDRLLQFVRRPLELRQPLAERLPDLGKLLGAENEKGHDENQD